MEALVDEADVDESAAADQDVARDGAAVGLDRGLRAKRGAVEAAGDVAHARVRVDAEARRAGRGGQRRRRAHGDAEVLGRGSEGREEGEGNEKKGCGAHARPAAGKARKTVPVLTSRRGWT